MAVAEAPGFDPNRFRETDYEHTRARSFLDAVEPGSVVRTDGSARRGKGSSHLSLSAAMHDETGEPNRPPCRGMCGRLDRGAGDGDTSAS